jgi:hypothetical protein
MVPIPEGVERDEEEPIEEEPIDEDDKAPTPPPKDKKWSPKIGDLEMID